MPIKKKIISFLKKKEKKDEDYIFHKFKDKYGFTFFKLNYVILG